MTGCAVAHSLARSALEIAHVAERHPKVVLAKELPPPQNTGPFRRVLRDIPAVEPCPAHPTIAARPEGAMNAQILGVILDQDQSWPPMVKVNARKHLGFVAFHIDGKKIDGMRRLRVKQDLIERSRFDLDLATAAGAWNEEIRFKRRMSPRHLQPGCPQGHDFSRILRRRAGDLVDPGSATLAQPCGKLGKRLDKYACPAALFEAPGLGIAFRIVGANLDKIS